MDETITRNRNAWPWRAWLMALVGALGGLAVFILTDGIPRGAVPDAQTIIRQALAAGVIVGTLSFLLTAERARLSWAIAFSVVWGAIVALVGHSTGGYNKGGGLFEFPFLSGLLAVGIAAPLFQATRDEGRVALPYDKVHFYAWTDAIIGAGSLAFTMLTFALCFLLGALFDAIGIALLKDLLAKDWFNWMVAGAAFGTASAVLRERDPLLGTLRRLVMLVFSVLAPVLAAALALYLLALPATGFGGLWKSGLPETPLLLSAAAFCFVLLNALIGDSEDERRGGRIWVWSELALLLAVLPLGALALVSMSMRVDQYGWTPERIWGVLACLVAIAFGAADWLAFWRGRWKFEEALRTYQKVLASALCGVALFLALPIVDFGAISTRSQIARLRSGEIPPDKLDWAAVAFDFGPSGRQALQQIKTAGGRTGRLAAEALASANRYEVQGESERLARQDHARSHARFIGDPLEWNDDLARRVTQFGMCGSDRSICVLSALDGKRLLVAEQVAGGPVTTRIVRLDTRLGKRSLDSLVETSGMAPQPASPPEVDLGRGPVEIRQVTRRQLFVDGKPVGDTFE